jgi:(p)ppGpp synthase/HD superfamily hydrolase
MASKGINQQQELHLTQHFSDAVDYVRKIHVGCRKQTKVPYLAHLLGVASLVMGENGYLDFPVTEDIVIAALLHDAVEDEGGWTRLRDIETNFGANVARMVAGCSDSFVDREQEKPSWESRKKEYLERLQNEPADTLLISAADKLYNARTILDDYRTVGPEVWKRFKRSRDQQLWYLRECLKTFRQRGPKRITDELDRVAADLERVTS